MNEMTPGEIQAYVDNRIDARMEAIATLAATKALDQIYAEVGQGVLKKLVWVVGIVTFALIMYLAGRGVKLPTP